MYFLTIVVAAVLMFGASWLLGPVARRLLRRAAAAAAERPVPDAWAGVIRKRVPYVAALSAPEQSRLLRHARELLATLAWEGCGGLGLTDDMRLVIAVQAALLTWKRPGPAYPRLKSVLVYPTTFRPAAPFEWVAAPGKRAAGPELGESWPDGTVVLAWDDVLRGAANPRDGRNVVLHEFAHQLDSADGSADGTPALSSPAEADSWQATLLRAYHQLEEATTAGTPSPIDPYGLTNRAEFFAVSTEAFFERPVALRKAYPELYERLAAYYGQDPAGIVRAQDGSTAGRRSP